MGTLRSTLWLCLFIALLATGCGSDDDGHTSGGDEDTLTVMTYNVYLGADLETVFQQLSDLPPGAVGQVAEAAYEIYDQIVNQSDFSLRAEAIADAIAAHEPHFVGLQEMALIRTGPPNFLLTGGVPDAEDIEVDFREALKTALELRGMDYWFDYQIANADVELPMHDGGIFFKDGRLTLFDVLLVRGDVEVSGYDVGNYLQAFSPPLTIPIAITRGYVMVEASVAGRTYSVVNTHLEAAEPSIRDAQAQQLLQFLGDGDAPIVLLGDFNSSPDIGSGIDDDNAYSGVIEAGFVDMWKDAPGTGFTCCQEPQLTADWTLSKRIDFVFVRNSTSSGAAYIDTLAGDAFLVGDQSSDRVADSNGTLIWPSDHAGVGAVLYVD